VSVRAAAALFAVLAALAGCGLKGPLYLPEKSTEVVVRPAPGTAPEAAGEGAPGPSTEPAALPDGPPEAPPAAATPPPPVPDASQIPPPGSGRG
jgi:predicted small lipoprotein YifL